MTYEELVSQIDGSGLHIIRVDEIDSSRSDFEFVGGLNEFLKAAKALKSEVVFMNVISISEEALLTPYTPNAEDEYDEFEDTSSEESFDLCEVLPALARFKSMVDVPGQFDLLVPAGGRNLTFSIIEGWWVDFVECFSEARLLVDKHYDQLISERRAEIQAERTKLWSKLRRLVSDVNFAKLPTQLAMREYAIERIPELSQVEESELKREIQSLKAKIQARGQK